MLRTERSLFIACTGKSDDTGDEAVWGAEAFAEVEQLASGHFENSWEPCGLDGSGQAVSAPTWTDTIMAENLASKGSTHWLTSSMSCCSRSLASTPTSSRRV